MEIWKSRGLCGFRVRPPLTCHYLPLGVIFKDDAVSELCFVLFPCVCVWACPPPPPKAGTDDDLWGKRRQQIQIWRFPRQTIIIVVLYVHVR